MTENELLDGCRRGEREAQRELYARTSPRIHRLLLRMTGGPESALDLAQDTYLRAFSRIGQFDGRSALDTWLYRIAVTEALQFLRRTKRSRTVLDGRRAKAVAPSPGDGSITRLDVHEALAALEPLERTMLLLRYQEGLDYRSIAEVVNCAEGTVGSRLNRAREHLRRLLGPGYAPAEGNPNAVHPKNGNAGAMRGMGL